MVGKRAQSSFMISSKTVSTATPQLHEHKSLKTARSSLAPCSAFARQPCDFYCRPVCARSGRLRAQARQLSVKVREMQRAPRQQVCDLLPLAAQR